MKIRYFEVGPFLENTYLLINGNEALLIDPGFSNESEFEHFKADLLGFEVELKAIVLTHAHVDHVLGLQRVLKDFPVQVFLNTNDLFLWNNFGNQSQMFGLNQVGFSFNPVALPISGNFSIGTFVFECLYTPGHAPDHTCLYFKNFGFVIAGDTLFRESIGRTDLYKGNFETLEKSIKEKLYILPNETKVYPGHGNSTTIGHEKEFNPFVKAN